MNEQGVRGHLRMWRLRQLSAHRASNAEAALLTRNQQQSGKLLPNCSPGVIPGEFPSILLGLINCFFGVRRTSET